MSRVWMLRIQARPTKWCWYCHQRLGATMSSASATPHQNQALRK
jgi:hypothetical protein